MMINEAKPVTEDDLKELRVKIPADLYRKLHSMRVLRGVAIRDIVEVALLEYFKTRQMVAHAAAPADDDRRAAFSSD